MNVAVCWFSSVPPRLHVEPVLICTLLFGDALNRLLLSFRFPGLSVAAYVLNSLISMLERGYVLNCWFSSVPPWLHVEPALICTLLFSNALNCLLLSFLFPGLNVAVSACDMC